MKTDEVWRKEIRVDGNRKSTNIPATFLFYEKIKQVRMCLLLKSPYHTICVLRLSIVLGKASIAARLSYLDRGINRLKLYYKLNKTLYRQIK